MSQQQGTVVAPQQQLSFVEASDELAPPGDRHIIVPIDDSDDSERACDWVIQNLLRKGDVIHLLHIVPEPQMVHVWAGMYVPPEDNAEEQEVQDAKAMVQKRFTSKLRAAKAVFKLHIVFSGLSSANIATVINSKATEFNAACIVMAAHGKTSFQEFWEGSVSSTVTHKAKTPTLVVH